MGTGIEPGITAPEALDRQQPAPEIDVVDIGVFELPTRRGFERGRGGQAMPKCGAVGLLEETLTGESCPAARRPRETPGFLTYPDRYLREKE